MTESAAAKASLRRRLLAARRELTPTARAVAAAGIASQVAQLPEITPGSTIAAYVGVGTEPGTLPAIDGLSGRGIAILLPLLRPDNDLDWAAYEGTGSLAPAPRGLLEPVGRRLGAGAVEEADVVLVPGLAVDRQGWRLGRGGGSYDRVLSRLGDRTWVAVILYEHEIIDHVPTDDHDRTVGAAVTPGGVHRFRSGTAHVKGPP